MIAAIEAALGLSTLWARIVATGGLVALVLSAWAGFAYHYESKGAAKEVAKIQKATNHATQTIRAAAARSSDPGVQGIRDPSTRDE